MPEMKPQLQRQTQTQSQTRRQSQPSRIAQLASESSHHHEDEEASRRAAREQAERERIHREKLVLEKAEKERAERERIQEEKLARERAEREEKERIAREHAKLVASHLSYVRDQWSIFQTTKHDAPPSLLPLEASRELSHFRKYLETQSLRTLVPEAIDAFESEINLQSQEARKFVDDFKAELRSDSLFGGLLKLVSFGQQRELLGKCIVSIEIPDLGSPACEAVAHACKFLRKSWSKKLDRSRQAMFSIHRCAGKTVMHVGASCGSVFITLPHSLEPEALAEAILSEIRKASSKLISRESTIAVIDGDHQALNYQKIFNGDIVVRSIKDDCDKFAANLDDFLQRDPPVASNTAVHFGLPANEIELSAVFPSGGADWDGLWRYVVPLWQNGASRQGFDRPVSASAEQILQSLTHDKNVIVVIAHANEQTIYMPAPPPKGSHLSTAQIVERKEEIKANKPVVYLFCCETAEISNLKSFSEVLLDCGAAAVVAPQTKIDAERSVDFFERVVQKTAAPDENALTKMRAAQKSSKYREMEIYLG